MFILRVLEIIESQKFISKLFLSSDDSSSGNESEFSTTSCLMIGLPCEMTNIELEIFLAQ